MTVEFIDMDTPPAPRPRTDTGALLEEAGWLLGGAIILVTVAIAIEVADVLRLVEEFREGRF